MRVSHRHKLDFRAAWVQGSSVVGHSLASVMQEHEVNTPRATHAELWSSLFPLPPQEECQNYVRVLIVSGRKVFLCGTNAFSPVCSSRQVGHWEGQAKRGVPQSWGGD